MRLAGLLVNAAANLPDFDLVVMNENGIGFQRQLPATRHDSPKKSIFFVGFFPPSAAGVTRFQPT